MRFKAPPALPAVALLLALSLPATVALAAPPVAPAPAPPATDPDTRSMIEALMPSAVRATRNLVVRQKVQEASSEAASAAAPSASVAGAALVAVAVTPSPAPPAAASTPAPAPAPAPVAAVPAPPPSLALAIQFEPNSYRVRPESGAVLGSLVAAMQSPELKTSRFVIEGHADPRGAAAHNQRLSQERADEVRLFLVSLGVHPARLRAVGKGASQPANSSDPGAPENRRVRVVTVE